MNITDIIVEYLKKNNSVDLPNIGTLGTKIEKAHLDKKKGTYYPDRSTVVFDTKASGDNGIVRFIAEKECVNENVAEQIWRNYMDALADKLQRTSEHTFTGVGTLRKVGGKFSFEAAPQPVDEANPIQQLGNINIYTPRADKKDPFAAFDKPAAPAQPEKPAVPETPAEPVAPKQPEQPVEPVKPAEQPAQPKPEAPKPEAPKEEEPKAEQEPAQPAASEETLATLKQLEEIPAPKPKKEKKEKPTKVKKEKVKKEKKEKGKKKKCRLWWLWILILLLLAAGACYYFQLLPCCQQKAAEEEPATPVTSEIIEDDTTEAEPAEAAALDLAKITNIFTFNTDMIEYGDEDIYSNREQICDFMRGYINQFLSDRHYNTARVPMMERVRQYCDTRLTELMGNGYAVQRFIPYNDYVYEHCYDHLKERKASRSRVIVQTELMDASILEQLLNETIGDLGLQPDAEAPVVQKPVAADNATPTYSARYVKGYTYKFDLIAGFYTNRGSADKMATRLKNLGCDAYIIDINHGYYVSMGGANTRTQAEALFNHLKSWYDGDVAIKQW